MIRIVRCTGGVDVYAGINLDSEVMMPVKVAP